MKKLIKAFKNPLQAYRYARSVIRGKWYIFKYQQILDKARFGSKFRAEGKLSIKGPGKVIFGDNVRIGMTVTPWTFNKDAIIKIGDNTYLNGTRFACESMITIGKDCIMADCRIMDTDFHGADPEYRDIYNVSPVVIENNVWITVGCVVLKGVTIGVGTTITPLSVVDRNIPHYVVAGGNPIAIKKELLNV